jgi:hypothetical protein
MPAISPGYGVMLQTSNRGLSQRGGVFTAIDHPGATITEATGINASETWLASGKMQASQSRLHLERRRFYYHW